MDNFVLAVLAVGIVIGAAILGSILLSVMQVNMYTWKYFVVITLILGIPGYTLLVCYDWRIAVGVLLTKWFTILCVLGLAKMSEKNKK